MPHALTKFFKVSQVPETGCALLADDYSISSKCRSNKGLKFLKYLLSLYHHKFQSRGIEIPLTVRNIRLSFFDCRQWQVTITRSESFIDTAWGSRLRSYFHICADVLLYYMSFRKTRICDGYPINRIVYIWTSDNSTKCEGGLSCTVVQQPPHVWLWKTRRRNKHSRMCLICWLSSHGG